MTEQQNTPELRFPEFKDEWNQIYLKEICDITSSKRVYAKDYVKQGIPFFRGKEISSNGFKHQEDLLYIYLKKYTITFLKNMVHLKRETYLLPL